jgi:hypothetical protein
MTGVALGLGIVACVVARSARGAPAEGTHVDLPPRAALRTPDVRVRVLGNRALPDAVYRHIIAEPELTISAAGARTACRRVERFLAAAAYPYAHVRCAVGDGALVVAVDEGTVERVAFPGQGGLTAVAASVVFDLEGRVFNRIEFHRSVERIERTLGVAVEGYELVKTSTTAAVPFQLSDLKGLATATGLRESGRYLLLIHLDRDFMSPGLGFGLGATGPDGLITEVRYRWADVLREDDRLKVGTELGLRATELVSGGDVPLISRGGLSLEQWSPEVFGPRLRWFAEARGTYLNRQRRDLGGASYDLLEPRASVGLAWRRGEFRKLRVGVGADYRYLIDSDLETAGARTRTTGFIRAFIDVDGSWAFFQPKSLRLDHSLVVRGYARAYATDAPYADLRLTVEKGFRIGRYNELRLEARGVALVGGYGIIDEYRVSDLFRGLYGDRLYAPRAATASAEFFLSLERERIRASVFVDGLAFRPSEFATGASTVRPGVGTGIGLHALFFEAYQGSVYGLVGIAQGRSVDGGFNFSLARMF